VSACGLKLTRRGGGRHSQLKVFPPKLFTFHLEVQTTGGNVVHVSVGNLFKRKKEKEPQVPVPRPSLRLAESPYDGAWVRSTRWRDVATGRARRGTRNTCN
jgi:hypothetical protein